MKCCLDNFPKVPVCRTEKDRRKVVANMEDFPHHKKVNKSGVNQGKRTCYAVYEDWFEAFEKRQRQNLADFEKALETKKNWDKEFLVCWKAISNYIKLEVLGDDIKPKIKEEIEK